MSVILKIVGNIAGFDGSLTKIFRGFISGIKYCGPRTSVFNELTG